MRRRRPTPHPSALPSLHYAGVHRSGEESASEGPQRPAGRGEGAHVDEPWIIESVPSRVYPVYSRANAGEVAPDPVSPLAATMALGGPGDLGYQDAYVSAGTFRPEEFEPGRANCVLFFGGYMYLSMSFTRIFGVRMPGMTPEMVDAQYFGDMPGITPYAEEARPTDEDPVATENLGRYLTEVLGTEDLPDLRSDRDQIARLVRSRPPLEGLTDQELVDHARSFMPLFRRLFCRHILVSSGVGIGIGAVSALLEAFGRGPDSMALFSGVGDVDSAAPNVELWELSRLVNSSPSLLGVLEDHRGRGRLDEVMDAVARRAQAGDEVAAAFVSRWARFLDRFGSRGPNEWDLRAPTWGTRPAIALAALASMTSVPDADGPELRTAVGNRRRDALEGEIRAVLDGVDEETRNLFDAALRCGRIYAAGRERTKTNCIAVVHEMRLAFMELARRHVDRGTLTDPDGVFMLTERELDDFVARPDEWSQALADRLSTYRRLFDHVPPFVTNGAPPHWSTWPRRQGDTAIPVTPGEVLQGIPGSPGTVRGRARVVTDPSDPRGLEPGEVLVAPLTDPAWTPLFVTASAVVVDVGAQITHAVIVSRELGLPCVVSVAQASRRIPDGAIIEVDGSTGTVTVIES